MDEDIDSLALRRRSTRQLIMQSREEYEASLPHSTPGPSGLGHKRTHSTSSPVQEEGSMSVRGRKRVKEEKDVGYGDSRRAIKAQGSRSATTFRRRGRIPSKGTRRRLSEDIIPVRRSKREKRLIFSNFNQQEIDRQLLKPNAFPVIDESSEEEMDPYEKLLSPHRRTLPKRKAAPTSFPMSLRSSGQFDPSDVSRGKQASEEGETETGKEGQGEVGEGNEEGTGSQEEEEEEEDDEDDEDESDNSEEEEEEEEGERGYFLRKRRPVIYQYQPVIQVVEDEAPPKRRGQTTRQRSSFYNKAARSVAPRAYQSRRKTHAISASATRRRAAHRDSTTTTSGSDSDEARFQRRKSRSMKRARMQCLPMNFVPEDATQGVIRDRTRIGASLADIDPMTIDRSVTFDSVGGLGHHIRALKEMIIFPLLYPEVFQRFKIQPPRGVLFYGPPGCGKTLVARALANECSKGGKNVAFFMRKGADCLSKWVGESERQLRLLFDQAYQMRPSIIFFDEIDGLAPVRSTRQDQIHSSIVSTLLALMDGLDARGEVVVIGATNRIDTIDPALRRPGRFDREFLFPLPSREDRLSILSIHTREWEPALRPDFLAELADNTVGYCGADLKALCTEATLHALRRKYPQIYQTSDKLVLDVSQINVAAADFLNALKAIVPTAQRSDASVACTLSEPVRPLLITQFHLLLALASFVFPHAWKAIGKAQKNLKVLLACEEERLQQIDNLVASFCDGELEVDLVPPSDSHEGRSENSTVATPKPDFNSFLRAGFSASGSKSRLKAAELQSTFQSMRESADKAASHSFSAAHSSVSVLNIGGRTYATDTGDRDDDCEDSADAQNRFSELYQSSQPTELAGVYFDMTETVYEEREEGSSRSILANQDADKSGDPSTRLQASPTSQNQETTPSGYPSLSLVPHQFLTLSTHPHATPTTYRPRLIICGEEGMGQSTHLAPALLHALEDIPVKILDLPGLYATSTKTPEEACTQVFREARRVAPSVVFIPRISSWWGVTTEALQATFLAALLSLPSSTPLLVLATAEEKWAELPRPLRDVFRGVSGESFTVNRPSLAQRRAFFSRVLLEKPLKPPPLKPRPSSEVCHAPLPIAPPPEPRELTQDELTKLEHQRGAVLRELRVFLRDATNKLLAERKFKEFTNSVNPEEVPDYYDIILEPMDLGRIMKKIDEHRYTIPKQWLRDVDLITKNALEYNPEHDSESRLLRHRAVALQDMAHSFLDHELSEDFEKQCEDIQETHQRLEGKPSSVSPPKALSTTVAAAAISQTSSASQSGNPPLSSTTEASLLDVAKRRSLRQKGLHPDAHGLPYYTPPKPRTPRKQNKDNAADGTEAVTQNSSPDDMELDQSGSQNSDTDVETPTRRPGEQAKSSVLFQNQNGSSADKLLHEIETDTPRNDVMESEPCEEDFQRENTESDSSTRDTQRRSLKNSLVKRQLLSGDKGDSAEADKKAAVVNGVAHAQTIPQSRRRSASFSSQSLGSASQEQAVANLSASKSGPQVFEKRLEDQRSSSFTSELINTSPLSSKISPTKELLEGESSEKLNASSLTPGGVNRPIVIDRMRLLAVFEQVTHVTGSCSVEQMEKLHSTFEHLVFRHRLKQERNQLVEDLKTATVLFAESHVQV